MRSGLLHSSGRSREPGAIRLTSSTLQLCFYCSGTATLSDNCHHYESIRRRSRGFSRVQLKATLHPFRLGRVAPLLPSAARRLIIAVWSGRREFLNTVPRFHFRNVCHLFLCVPPVRRLQAPATLRLIFRALHPPWRVSLQSPSRLTTGVAKKRKES